ncbi:hypothetical protein MX659_03990 [Coriobacteriia bacterium Es71-Z0120]|uniref:hypothetical protein n=1 Tax=Parvivirga hydrogeniphila TaxID=2939460 RepID=UPI00226103D1|nr:hypothetical protein [Parvivirga hydrogeniphila]MCL4078759.1 hypothetical protein [Parvivirga hydrogeniphila]
MRAGRWAGHAQRFCLAVLLCALVAGLAACGGRSADHPAVRAVRELLVLRRTDVRDARAYTRFFEDSALATALVEPGAVPTGTPRVPDWRDVYLSKAGSSTADVAVVWKPDEAFKDWPKVTVFSLSLVRDRWVVVDAREETSAPKPVDPERSK